MSPDFETARAAFVEGLADYQAGRFDAAEARFRAALAALPGRPSTLMNLGATLLKLGRADEALPLLNQALVAEPNNLQTLAHHALALAELGRDVEALVSLDAVLALDRRNATAWLHRGLGLARLNRAAEALAAFDAALEHAPQLTEAWAHRGALNKELGRHDAARADLQQALALGAEPSVNRFLLASVGGSAPPPTAPPAYVGLLFDSYAQGFDRHLVDELGYSVHEELPQGLASRGLRFDAALDLGCGTGLCGPQLAPLVQRLDGIDLSPRMLELAQQRGVYDTLRQDEIVQHLQQTPQRYDLVLAADVFIYIGDLRPVFAGVRRVLREGGWFSFSVEPAEPAHDFELRSSSRYAHSARYLRALAAQHGFDDIEMRPSTLRMEQGQPLPGLLVWLRLRSVSADQPAP